jgi:hypothetical protein
MRKKTVTKKDEHPTQVPFSTKESNAGSLVSTISFFNKDIVWKDNYEFDGQLMIAKMYKYANTLKVTLCGENGEEYPMFFKDFTFMVNNATIDYGEVSGRWTFTKRGNSFGIKMIVKNETI